MNTYRVSFTATYWVDADDPWQAENLVYEAMLGNGPNHILDTGEVDDRTVNVVLVGTFKESE